MPADNLSLAGRFAIITGSGRENGIGAAIALAFARNGASVALNYVSESSAPRAALIVKEIESLGVQATAIQAGIDTPEGAKKLVQGVLEAFKTDHIDILVNNAGYGFVSPSLHVPPEEALKVFGINVLGALYLVQETVPYMPRGSRIINIGSVVSKLGVDFMSTYAASKAALDSYTFSWAEEFGRSRGITVNLVAPGPVYTEMIRGAEESLPLKTLLNMTRAEERFGNVEDVAGAVLLLTSEKSRWITGQYISVSGGISGL